MTGKRPGGGTNVVLRQVAGGLELSLALRPDDRVHVGLDDAARIGVERDLRLVARLDLVQLVLAEQREDLILVVDEGHHLVERHAGDEEAGAEHDVHHRAVAGREHVVCVRSQRALSSCARVVSTCACGHLHLRLGRGDLRLDLRDRREVAVDAACELFAHLLLGRARRRKLRRQLVDVRLRLLEIEAIAGAGGDELGVLRDALARQVERRRKRRHLPVACFSCSRSWRSLDCASVSCACTSASRCRSAPTLASSAASFASSELHFVLIGRRIDPEQHVALLHRPVVLDRHLDHASPDLRDDRHDVLDDPDVARRRREDVEQEQHERRWPRPGRSRRRPSTASSTAAASA